MIVRLGSRFTSVLGLSFITVAAVVMLLISELSPLWLMLAGTFMYGLGFGFSVTAFTIIAQSSVGFRQRGASTALNTFLRTLGQTVGVAAFGSWLNYRITEQSAANHLLEQGVTQEEINGLLAAHSGQQISADTAQLLRQVLEGGLHSLFVIMTVIAVISWIVVWGLRNQPPAPEGENAASAGHGGQARA